MVILSRFSEAYFSKTQVLLVLHGFLTVAGGFSCRGSGVQMTDAVSTPSMGAM